MELEFEPRQSVSKFCSLHHYTELYLLWEQNWLKDKLYLEKKVYIHDKTRTGEILLLARIINRKKINGVRGGRSHQLVLVSSRGILKKIYKKLQCSNRIYALRTRNSCVHSCWLVILWVCKAFWRLLKGTISLREWDPWHSVGGRCVEQKEAAILFLQRTVWNNRIQNPGALLREGIMRCHQSQGPIKPLMHNEYVTCRETKRKTNFKDRDSVIQVNITLHRLHEMSHNSEITSPKDDLSSHSVTKAEAVRWHHRDSRSLSPSTARCLTSP